MPDLAEVRRHTGHEVVGSFAFGDSPDLADELLAYVTAGTKRATAGDVAALATADEPFPEPGQRWAVLDGSGALRYVIETVEATRGTLASVTPAFAWDEGEDDRTREHWLEGHRRYFRRQDVPDPDRLEVAFERFRVVWPEPDTTRWLVDGVRELRFDERAWLRDVYSDRWGTTTVVSRGRLTEVADLPALVCERSGERIGLLTFLPRPGVDVECVTIDAFVRGAGVGAALTAGIRALGQRSQWRRLWLVTTNDNTAALRACQRAGWDLVTVHRDAAASSRRLKPSLPRMGLDGIPIRHELELELPLTRTPDSSGSTTQPDPGA